MVKSKISSSVINICGVDFDTNIDELILTYDYFIEFKDYACLDKFKNYKHWDFLI